MTKKKFFGYAAIVIGAVLVSWTLYAAIVPPPETVGIIGGADGPTAIYVAEEDAK